MIDFGKIYAPYAEIPHVKLRRDPHGYCLSLPMPLEAKLDGHLKACRKIFWLAAFKFTNDVLLAAADRKFFIHPV